MLILAAVLAVVVGFVWATVRLVGYLFRVVIQNQEQRPHLVRAAPWGAASVFGFTGACLVYLYAYLVYSPGLYPDKTCMSHAGSRISPEHHDPLPLSTICGGVEIVPGWVNPTLVVLANVVGGLGVIKLATLWPPRR